MSKETTDTNYNYIRHVCIVNKQIDFSLQVFIQFVRYFNYAFSKLTGETFSYMHMDFNLSQSHFYVLFVYAF